MLVNGVKRILPTKWVLVVQWLLGYAKSFFAILSFFLLLWWPGRSWEITTRKRESLESCHTFVSFVFGLVVLIGGLLKKAAMFTVLKETFSALYCGLTDSVPEIAVIMSLAFAICISSPQMDFKSRLVLYVFLLVITYYVSILELSIFFFIFSLNMYDTYGQTSNVQRWLLMLFTASCFERLISDYIGLMFTVWKVILFVIIVQAYAVATRWVHGNNDVAVLVEHGYRERFFQRGNAKVQFDFVTRNLRVFSFIIFVSALVTVDLLRCSDSTLAPETISNVFCKIDNERQLECVVQVSYADPYEPEKCQCNISSAEWDFCGVFCAAFAY